MLTAREIGPKDRPIKMMMDTIVFDHKSSIITSFDGDGSIRSSAECLKVELVLKDVQQPQPQQPSPPPGGPSLQPPPNLR
jgi:hypothetical protein